MSSTEQLITYHFPKDVQDNAEQSAIINEAHELADDDPEFSQKDLDAVFMHMSRGKAPELNGIPIEVVKIGLIQGVKG